MSIAAGACPSDAPRGLEPGRAAPWALPHGPRALVVGGVAGTAHAVLDLVWGLPLALAVLVALAVGVFGLSAFLIGAVVLVGVLAAARALAAVERARFAAVLGVEMAAPPPIAPGTVWRRSLDVVVSGASWRALLWTLVLPFLGAVWTTVVVCLWAGSATLLTAPLWVVRAEGAEQSLFLDVVARPLGAAAAVVAGVLLVPVALLAAIGCARADTALARLLLGTSRTAALDRRVATLTTTRAAAVDAADAERRRIERDLHDGAQQRLVALAVTLGMASAALEDEPGASPRALELVRTAHAESKAAVAELRDLARGIHPAVLTDRGLDAALSALAARCPVPVVVDVAPEAGGRCSPTVEATAYFVVAEALTNVARHSGASNARVAVRRHGDRLVVLVVDDGRGGASAAAGGGLAGLAQRAAGVDGSLHVDSPPGGPTSVSVSLPCAAGTR